MGLVSLSVSYLSLVTRRRKVFRVKFECFKGGGAGWTYVRPVDRFIPARMVETATKLAPVHNGEGHGLPTQDGIKSIVKDSSELSP
jgi:hypothetical protein